jgi:hypothetical protein
MTESGTMHYDLACFVIIMNDMAMCVIGKE